MIKCEIDGQEFKNGGVLSRHLKRVYKITYKEYYHKYVIKSENIPRCQCGCDEKLEWTSIGYRKYKGNHGLLLRLKINNPWGDNKKAQEKSAETRRKQFASGERKTWCDGLTLQNSPSLQSAAKKLSERYTPEIRKHYSDKMSTMRKDGTLPTLYREKSSRWKGGVSSIQQIARSDKRLYEQWKYPILIRDGFKCTTCDNSKDLHVHHDGETFSEIIKKVMTLDDYDKIDNFEVKKSITNKVVDYHIEKNISGITLCKDCHNNFHPSLNF
jgi:hypothetical protein